MLWNIFSNNRKGNSLNILVTMSELESLDLPK